MVVNITIIIIYVNKIFHISSAAVKTKYCNFVTT